MHLSRHNILLPVNEEGKYILLNGLSSAMDIVDRELVKTLEKVKNGYDQVDTDILAELKKRGYVFDTVEQEDNLLNFRLREYEKRIENSPPAFYLYPTYACNLRCSYCFQDHSARKGDLIDEETLTSAFCAMDSLLKESPSKRVPYFVLFGGEPLLKRKKQFAVIEKILQESNNRGWKPKVVSNGVDLEHYVDLLASYNLLYVQVTIDGPEHIHNKRRCSPTYKNSFNKILQGVQKAVDKGIRIAIRINVDAENIFSLPELANVFMERGWEKERRIIAYIAPMRDISCMEYAHRLPEPVALHHIFALYRNYGEMRVIQLLGWVGAEIFREVLNSGRFLPPNFKFCDANMSRYCLDLNGDIYTCINSTGVEEYKVGRFTPKLEIDEKALKRWRNRSVLQIPHCSRCEFALVCGGGCSKLANEKLGDLYQPLCNDIADVLKESAQYYYSLLKEKTENEKKCLK